MKYTESYYKQKFKSELWPFLDMLEEQRSSDFKWLDKVRKTANSIVQNPEQYLGIERPSQDVTERLIGEIFDQFMNPEPMVAER